MDDTSSNQVENDVVGFPSLRLYSSHQVFCPSLTLLQLPLHSLSPCSHLPFFIQVYLFTREEDS